mmetsp:Transcript_7333/g.11549  ORF Transcript_7333/g.11549 Transcript_7333/m.11549 type:complete len:82 (+) Transcript_7333:387-632(+)
MTGRKDGDPSVGAEEAQQDFSEAAVEFIILNSTALTGGKSIKADKVKKGVKQAETRFAKLISCAEPLAIREEVLQGGQVRG